MGRHLWHEDNWQEGLAVVRRLRHTQAAGDEAAQVCWELPMASQWGLAGRHGEPGPPKHHKASGGGL